VVNEEGHSPVRSTGDSRTRVLAALDHREPDRVPFDLGATRNTGIHVHAHQRLRAALDLPAAEPLIADQQQQLARPEDDLAELLGVDVRGIFPRPASTYRRVLDDDGTFVSYRDEFGIGRRMPKEDGLYFDPYLHPLEGDITDADVDRYAWPEPEDPARAAGMLEEARRIVEQEGRAVYVVPVCTGFSEVYFRLRGYEDGYMDMAANPALAARIMDRILELKLGYWEAVFAELGDLVDVAGESEDLGSQTGLLFSPETYRALLKPRQAELFRFIHARSRAKVFLHSCGAIRPLIPDLIEVGVDVLNPVQVSAAGMDSAELKRDFGRELTFWGGGVDSQRVLGSGSPSQVRDEVRRRIDDLRPGGGFVFAAVHNIQPDVPAENVIAMWETLREHGAYRG
jgi:uroporphyrinogen decarboxylase